MNMSEISEKFETIKILHIGTIQYRILKDTAVVTPSGVLI
jgi:hypothetical protein